jgi:hypothetical protein
VSSPILSATVEKKVLNFSETSHVLSLINLSIDTGVFPDSLKKAQVTPLHKKNDPLGKTNYRPVSVLPVFT